MIFRPFLYEPTACASYLFGCLTYSQLAVVDPHAELVDTYVAEAERIGAPIVAVFETHVQADHVSGLPELVARTGATAYLPEGAGVDFPHHALADGEVVGFAALIDRAAPGLLEHGLTATRRTHRRRGIATALKRTQIAWAAANGYRELLTFTQEGNEGMQAINLALGYEPQPPWIRVWRLP